MTYWWVNHSSTHSHEIAGGYIWCPPTDARGKPRPTYDTLMEVSAGDIVFSYARKAIREVGVVKAPFVKAPKPDYGARGASWRGNGWLVALDWMPLLQPFHPLPAYAQLRPLMPEVHAPLTREGKGAANVYLAEISDQLGELLLQQLEAENSEITRTVKDIAAERAIAASNVSETTKKQLINARVGQGLFRSRVSAISPRCRVTGTADPRVLIASHIKPWCESTNEERLDGHNGLLLAPHVDKLFDRFWISFQDDGQLITAGPAVVGLLRSWGIDPDLRTEPLTRQQRKYMAHHRARMAEVDARGQWI